jgi:O-methyltransferase
MGRFILKVHYVLTAPFAIYFILSSKRIDPAYRMGFFKKLWLGFRMFRNKLRIQTGSTFKAHLAMALKILETPPEVAGDILECGTWKGGSAANLSLVCRIVGRKLKIYDSFEGLPEGDSRDREASHYKKGDYVGQLDEVKANIGRCGAIECCEFIQGWFDNTLPGLKTPVLLAFLDVDLESSLHTCVKYIWPKLTERGFMFIDEAVTTSYCALFYSEKWWRTYLDRVPPGLIGAGTGLPLWVNTTSGRTMSATITHCSTPAPAPIPERI